VSGSAAKGPDIVWVLAGPSGSGKTTLAQALVARSGNLLRRARTCTTRPPRPGEKADEDYRFVTADAFCALRERGELLEETLYNGHRYGVPASELELGGEVVVVVDPPGIANLRGKFGDRVVAIGLAGLSESDLSARMTARGTSKLEIAERLRNLGDEAAALARICDYQVPPGTPEEVLASVETLIKEVRGRFSRPR
jgi:guanylate kinase